MKRMQILGLLVLTLIYTGCDTSSDSNDPKTIGITNFPGSTYNGRVAGILLYRDINDDDPVTVGEVIIYGNPNILSFSLKTDTDLKYDWTGTGSFIVFLVISNSRGNDVEKMFLYTDGAVPNMQGSNIPKFTVNSEYSTIGFNQFYDISSYMSIDTSPALNSMRQLLVK